MLQSGGNNVASQALLREVYQQELRQLSLKNAPRAGRGARAGGKKASRPRPDSAARPLPTPPGARPAPPQRLVNSAACIHCNPEPPPRVKVQQIASIQAYTRSGAVRPDPAPAALQIPEPPALLPRPHSARPRAYRPGRKQAYSHRPIGWGVAPGRVLHKGEIVKRNAAMYSGTPSHGVPPPYTKPCGTKDFYDRTVGNVACLTSSYRPNTSR